MSEPPLNRIVSEREQSESNTARIEQLQDYSAALRTLHAARGVFLLILILSLVLHVGAYAAVRWGDVLAQSPECQKQMACSPDSPVAEVTPDAELVEAAQTFSYWYYLMRLALPLLEFLGQISCGVLTLSFLLAALVCLSGGLGGVRGSVSAFFWMLVLLALLFPWGRWLGSGPDVVQLPGVYFTFDELCKLPRGFGDRIEEVVHHVRYLGYPLLALLIAFTGDRRFARGYRLVQRHLESRLNVKKI